MLVSAKMWKNEKQGELQKYTKQKQNQRAVKAELEVYLCINNFKERKYIS